MHLYWRVQQDLNCLGETILFHEPCFIRSLQRWVRHNSAGLALAEDRTYDALCPEPAEQGNPIFGHGLIH